MMYQHLTPDYQEKVLNRWKSVLAVGKPIENETAALATALVLENTQREFQKTSLLKEGVYGIGGGGSGEGAYNAAGGGIGGGGGALGSDQSFGVNDSRIPAIVIPTLRRIFPELIAHDLCGVQPMNGPVGFAYALRYQYGVNGMGVAGGSASEGSEIGYNTIDSRFTGASGMLEEQLSGNYVAGSPAQAGIGTLSSADAYWQAFAGNSSLANGTGAGMLDSEWWRVGTDMPMAKFILEKGIVEAKSRKLAAHWSLELAEDMMNMHGVDTDAEMVNCMSYEIQAEIDRQLLGEMVKASIIGGTTSEWSPVSADGRHQQERIGTIYTQMLIKSQRIAILTRRGPATFAVADPTTCGLLERVGNYKFDDATAKVDTNNIGIAKVGTLRNGGLKLYRDTFAAGNYILLGYKGPTAYDTGVVFCPYIPVSLNRAVGTEDFTPRIGVRTRYGVLANLFGSANFYQMIRITGLTASALSADSRVFTF